MNPRPNGPVGAATAPGMYVATADIPAAIKGRETDLFDALGTPWRDDRPHINCPYPDTLRGFVSLTVQPVGLVIADCTLDEKGGTRWVGSPERPQQHHDRTLTR